MAGSNKVGQTLMWGLMGLLIVGLSGFGVSNFGGTVRSIGSVEGEDISTDEYFRALRTDINAMTRQTGRGVTMAEAQAMGLDAAVRQRLVTTAALDAETARLGLSVGDDRLAKNILDIPVFHGQAGFDRNAYAQMLRENGWSETQFETRMRGDIARGLIQTAVATGFAGSDAVAAAVIDYAEERRSFALLRLTEADLATPVAPLDEAAVKAFYEANPALFTRPETRRITYAALLADDVGKTITVDEAELRKLYDQRLSEFVQPERRLVERLVYPDEAAALAARSRLDAGQVSFEELTRERGLTLTDIDMGDVSKADLGEAGEGVFALSDLGVVGPLPSPFGPALYSMNGILAAEEITFEQARADLTAEFALDAARRQISPKTEAINDLLAGGATIEDLAKDAGMTVATIELEPGQEDGIAAFPNFRAQAAKLGESDFPEVIALGDGGLAVLRLDAILPPELRPFEAVKDKAAELAQEAAVQAAVEARATEIEAELAKGAALGNFGIVSNHPSMPRGARIDAAPADLIAKVFGMTEGEVARIAGPGFIGLVRLETIIAADHTSPEAEALKTALTQRMGQEMGQDAFDLYAQALEAKSKITLNEGAINAVHAQMR